MDIEGLRKLSAAELCEVLDGLGIQPGWVVGDNVRRDAVIAPDLLCLEDGRDRRNAAFENLVVGTLAERVFRDQHLAALEPDGFEVADYHESGENRDFGVQRDARELPINVKVASTMFREAHRVVHLDPEDCIPLGAYKAIGASERVPALVYVYLVDFTLRERVDAFMEDLDEDLAIGWDLLSWFGGRGMKRAQNQYIASLFKRHGSDLRALAPDGTSFRAISAQRALAIMRTQPRRVPGLGVKAAGTGVIRGEVNIHVSVEQETKPWVAVADLLRTQGVQHVLDLITQTAPAEIPNPDL
jgi:hypothetical protein